MEVSIIIGDCWIIWRLAELEVGFCESQVVCGKSQGLGRESQVTG